jgi:hypothetical protein
MGDRYVCRRASRQADATKSRKKRKLNANQSSTAAFRMNCLRRHKAKAVSERFICRRASERSALHERLTKTIFQHFIHSICCLIDRVSG